VIRRPGKCGPFVTLLRPYNSQLVFVGFEKKEIAAVANGDIVAEFRPKRDDCMFKVQYSLDTASASMNIITLLCHVAGVRTADFATVYAQISFLGSFIFSFLLHQRRIKNYEC